MTWAWAYDGVGRGKTSVFEKSLFCFKNKLLVLLLVQKMCKHLQNHQSLHVCHIAVFLQL